MRVRDEKNNEVVDGKMKIGDKDSNSEMINRLKMKKWRLEIKNRGLR